MWNPDLSGYICLVFSVLKRIILAVVVWEEHDVANPTLLSTVLEIRKSKIKAWRQKHPEQGVIQSTPLFHKTDHWQTALSPKWSLDVWKISLGTKEEQVKAKWWIITWGNLILTSELPRECSGVLISSSVLPRLLCIQYRYDVSRPSANTMSNQHTCCLPGFGVSSFPVRNSTQAVHLTCKVWNECGKVIEKIKLK